MILWGPPGVGKTTLARLMADAFNAEFIAISAVLAGVKDIRDAVARAEAVLAQSGRADDPVRRRGAPLQQGAAGRVPAVRRAGRADVHRRDHRESVVRGERRVAVARRGLRAGAAVGGGPRASLLDRAVRGGDAGRRARRAGARRADRLRRRRWPAAHQPGRATRGRGDARRGAIASTSRSSSRRSRAACAASTRAARRSTTRSRRCTRRCAAPIPTPRSTGCAGCSTAAPIRSTSRAG